MSADQTADRRSSFRREAAAQALVTVEGADLPVEETLCDISMAGLCLRSKTPIEPGKAINVRMQIEGGTTFEARGRTVWCARAEGHYKVGVIFSKDHGSVTVRLDE